MRPTNPSAAANCLAYSQLRRRAEIHRQAGIDQREEVQVLFFQEQFDDELVEPGVQVPIERPQVVARHVAAEVGKLDALPLALAAPLALHAATKNFARHQLQPFKLSHEIGRQKFGFGERACAGEGYRMQGVGCSSGNVD